MPEFSHLDRGTPEAVWIDDGRIDSAPAIDTDIDDLVVIAAHPDDETLGAAGLIRRIHRQGGRVTVVIATDGEASHPDSRTHRPADLAALRRREVISAVQMLAPRARVDFLALPDGGLQETFSDLETALAGIIDAITARPDRVLVVAPWSGDGHRDHRIIAEAVSRVAGARGIRHLGYPIWLWHWGTPADVPWERGGALIFEGDESDVKERALGAHLSQIRPLSGAAGDEAIVSAQMAGHFMRDTEIFLSESADDAETIGASWFEEFYARNDDPWGFETRWYEKRKRALLLASLPWSDLGSVLEIGCSTGLVTIELAARATRVLALDASESAVRSATDRVAERSHVDVRHGVVPLDWPEGEFDTIVLSEVGYYLSRRDLARAIEQVESSLAEGGTVIACHWRHRVAEYPLTGDEVHRALRAARTWRRLAIHEEEDFVLEVFTRGTGSVARAEALV